MKNPALLCNIYFVDMKNIWINVVENQPKTTQNDQTMPNNVTND